MDSKICVVCNIEKSIDNFYNKYRECKSCNIIRSTKRYNENKDKISNQQKIYYEKNRDYRNKMTITKKEAHIIKNYKKN